MLRPEVHFRCSSGEIYLVFWQSLTGLGSLITSGWLPARPRDPPVSASPEPGLQAWLLPDRPRGLWGWDSGSHALTASVILTEFLQPRTALKSGDCYEDAPMSPSLSGLEPRSHITDVVDNINMTISFWSTGCPAQKYCCWALSVHAAVSPLLQWVRMTRGGDDSIMIGV